MRGSRRRQLQELVQQDEGHIQSLKRAIASIEENIEQEAAIASKVERQGEPSVLPCQPLLGPIVAMPTVTGANRYWGQLVPCQPRSFVARPTHCYANPVAMVTCTSWPSWPG